MITHITDKELALTHTLTLCTEALKQATAERDALKEDLIFVERWANHHGTKPCHSAESILGVIQHYPTIKAITKSYADGVLPTTPDPYAERDALRAAAQAGLDALVSVLDDDKLALNLSVSGGVYEGVECKTAITQLQAALKGTS